MTPCSGHGDKNATSLEGNDFCLFSALRDAVLPKMSERVGVKLLDEVYHRALYLVDSDFTVAVGNKVLENPVHKSLV